VSARFGVRGGIPTLEELGVEEGITRERVRQIIQQFSHRSKGWRPALLTLDILQEGIYKSGSVVSWHELQSTVGPLLRLTARDIDLISNLLEIGWLRGLRESRFRGVWIAGDADEDQLDTAIASIRKRARRSMNKWGAVDLADFISLAGGDGAGLMVGVAFG
jgi:hypothetical protein